MLYGGDLILYNAAQSGLDGARKSLGEAALALEAAKTTADVMDVHMRAKVIEGLANMAKNLDVEIRAARIRFDAEVRLGEMLACESKRGVLRAGRPAHANGDGETPLNRVKLQEIGVDKKLSSQTQRLAALGRPRVAILLDAMEAESRKRGRLAGDVIQQALAKRNADTRRALASELSEASVALSPTGRKFPVLYADPAWQRKAGIGDRAYENSFETMTWQEILDMPVANRLLPDAWGFVWFPRAHLLALVEIDLDTPLGRCRMKVPLAWAIMRKWGFDSYSTLAVWTKTDDEFPDDQGTGLIFYDQDELLVVFKKGQGLPKPDSDKKHGSNHRARSGRHSEKPAYYRAMINDMTDGLPVLELFAREDDDHVLPENFHTWGNQSKHTADLAE